MRLDGNQARAARAAARREPIEYAIGDGLLTFKPEMPLDVLFGVEKAFGVSLQALRIWMLAHLQLDAKCQTECVDGTDDDAAPRVCETVQGFKDRLRHIRVDGAPLDEQDVDALWDAVRDAQGVTDPESSSSADSSEQAGDTSSEISPEFVSRATFSVVAPEASAG